MFVRTRVGGVSDRWRGERKLAAEIFFAWSGWGVMGVRTDVRVFRRSTRGETTVHTEAEVVTG